MRDDIARHHGLLNSVGLVQPRWYDRNHKAYELLCYVNTIVGLYLAENYEPIPPFLDRVYGYLSREDKAQVSEGYRQAVEAYIRLIARDLDASPQLAPEAKAWIPKVLLANP